MHALANSRILLSVSKDEREQRRAQARAEREAAEAAAGRSAQRRKRLTILGGILAGAIVVVVAVVLIAGGGGSSTSSTVTQASGDTVAGESAIAEQLGGIPQNGITLGKADAPITIVEYGDLQCPICAEFSNTVLPSVVNDYVRTGKARIQFRNISFIGDDSPRLAQMAAAAGEQDKLFDFIELVYANQGEENSGYATDAYLKKIASAIPGLDVATALKARSSTKVQAQLTEAEQLAQANGVTGTPTLFVGKSGQTPTQVQTADLLNTLKSLSS
jgi:protein-disulfide isomerase